MADIYKFKVRLCELENAMWREIELTSVSSVAKLGYVVLAHLKAQQATCLIYDLMANVMKSYLKRMILMMGCY